MRLLAIRCLLALGILALAGCAEHVQGYQNTYQGYNIPQPLMDKITVSFRENGLDGARIVRDSVGRARLAGHFRDDTEVESAFLLAQSIVGMKATSPFYPQDVQVKDWEVAAAQALRDRNRPAPVQRGAPHKRALVVGINDFLHPEHVPSIHGKDDAETVSQHLKRAGYQVTELLGAQATKANIESAIAQVEKDLGPEDTLFIYVSSHGMRPVPTSSGGDERRMSIIAYDSGWEPGRTKGKNADVLQMQRSSVRDTLVQHLAARPSRVTRVFIDTCFSGDMLNDVPSDSREFILKTNDGQPERAGVALASWTGPKFESKGIRLSDDAGPAGADQKERSKPATFDRTRAGYMFITATSENEVALGPADGVFASPVSTSRSLLGSYFTQAYFEYLDSNEGQTQPAFEAARRFTEKTAQGFHLHQVPRQVTTIQGDQDNLFK